MSDDRYRLTPMRDARARAERVQRGELADAIGDARTRDAELADASARVDAARAELATAVAARSTRAGRADQLARADRFIVRLRRQLADATAELDRLELARARRQDAIDGARRALTRARAEREVIERHFARWRDARRKLVERRAD